MLSINLSELIWTVVNFFLLYFLLKRFLYDPILRHMDARDKRLAEAEAQENAARAEVEAARAAVEESKAGRRAEAKELLAAAAEEDDAQSAAALAAARAAADETLRRAGEHAEAERTQDRSALAAEEEALAAALARQLLGEERSA